MATNAEALTQLTNRRNELATNLNTMGVSASNTETLKSLNAKVLKIEGGGTSTPSESTGLWTRPTDRPVKPTMEDNTILFLFGVGENMPNDIAFQTNNSIGSYQIDWGDGTVETLTTVYPEHMYDYDSIDVEPDSNGYKMVWITMTCEGNITLLNLLRRHSSRLTVVSAVATVQVFELYIQCPMLSTLTFGSSTGNVSSGTRYSLLEIFSLSENNITGSLQYLLINCYSLKLIEKLEIEKAINLNYFMYNCYSFNGIFPDGITFSNAGDNFMYNCYSYNQKFPDTVSFDVAGSYFMYNCSAYNQTFPDGITFSTPTSYFMYYCSAYNQAFPEGVTFNKVTLQFMRYCATYNQEFPSTVTFRNITTYFMASCTSFNKKLPVFSATGNNLQYFLNYCSSYNYSVTIDLSYVTTAIGTGFIGTYNYAQKGLRLLNMGSVHNALTVAYSPMSYDALKLLIGDLYDRSSTTTGTLTITGCYGASEFTSEEIDDIKNTINWTVVT